jgi:ADP-ribosylglycohydrolase
MALTQSSYRGCLLGLAVGDAMGYTVDGRTWAQIQADYGPNGLLGYDLVNGYADVTSYTQLATFAANGLLLGMTRGQLQGKMAPFIRYIGLACREWAASQRRYNLPDRTFCWTFRVPELRRRRCMDTWMLSTLDRDPLGTMEEPVNRYASPASITLPAAVGLFCASAKMDQAETDRLGAEAVALLHGSPLAFLSGAVVANIISRLLADQTTPLKDVYAQAIAAIQDRYEYQFPQVHELAVLLRQAINLAENTKLSQVETMEHLVCDDAHQVLAGAIYASLSCAHDFDSAMICAVNHSGRSAGVGALTGAFLGARMGEEALPEFYMECLEVTEPLRTLADDLLQGCPMEMGNRLFDGDWESKYLHGEY